MSLLLFIVIEILCLNILVLLIAFCRFYKETDRTTEFFLSLACICLTLCCSLIAVGKFMGGM